MPKLLAMISNLLHTFFTDLREKRQEVVGQLKSLQAETDVITKIFEEPEVQRQIQSSRLENIP